MRWADLDLLDHVNNVVYLTYAAEARAAMVDDGLLPAEPRPLTTTVRFVRPLRLGRRAVVVASSVDGDTITQQVALDGDDGRTVFAEVTSVSGERTRDELQEGVPTLPISLRRDDLDVDGVATVAKVFELVQETRVLHVSSQVSPMRPGRFVVGTSSVTFRDDVRWTTRPLLSSAWVSRVGRGSFDVRSQLSDGGAVLVDSTTTMVGFDPAAQASKPFDDEERALLAGVMVPAASAGGARRS